MLEFKIKKKYFSDSTGLQSSSATVFPVSRGGRKWFLDGLFSGEYSLTAKSAPILFKAIL